ncbi:AraC family transcriptional regulator [Hyphomicrobium nitrativorans NL23]|uniref:AraC family transcriptional regulator n=2 Tax=Hyphomicrobium TaxID=81 RepID=V5SI00_9HYPH|nr:AraC family transcriptional regulator [Hyphomicrobium nitrativorans NL23]
MDPRIAKAMLMLEERMSEDLRIEDIAKMLGLSLHHFHRLFVSESGETPAGYLRRIRLDSAALQLQWSDQPSRSIGHLRGYASQAAFTRAFRDRFGVTPLEYRKAFRRQQRCHCDTIGAFEISVREVESFLVLSRRFIGDISSIPQYWERFLEQLPPAQLYPASAVYLGLLHDDPDVTPEHQTRYDCAITVPQDWRDRASSENLGLNITTTRAGLYACLDHVGPPDSIPGSYDLLCRTWLPRSGYHATDDPAVELHYVPRHRQNPQQRRFTILLPIE